MVWYHNKIHTKKIDDLIVKYENEVIKNQLKINKGGK